jgi:hypothetical protein
VEVDCVEVVLEVVVDVVLVEVTRVVVVAFVVAVVVAVPGRHWPINAQKISVKTTQKGVAYTVICIRICAHSSRDASGRPCPTDSTTLAPFNLLSK